MLGLETSMGCSSPAPLRIHLSPQDSGPQPNMALHKSHQLPAALGRGLATSLPVAAQGSRGFHKSGITYELDLSSASSLEMAVLGTAPKSCRKAAPSPGTSRLLSGEG